MTLVREVASLGRAARSSAKLKVRQPLSKVEVILADTSPDDAAWLAAHAELVCDELNVKQFEICREPDRYITRSVLPDLKKLGPRLGKLLPQARDALTKADAQALLAGFARDGRVELSLPGGTATVERDDVLIRTTPREGWAAAEGTQAVVVVAAGLTPELIAEGLAREVVHAVQTARKGLDLEFTDTIDLAFETASADLRSALEHHRDSIASETLAAAIHFGPGPAGASAETIDVDGHPLTIHIQALERQKDRA
jgi:isoleucyl-tRNA synthetase